MDLTTKEKQLLQLIAARKVLSFQEGMYVYKTKQILADSFKRLILDDLIELVDYGKYGITKKGTELNEISKGRN